LTRTVYCKLKQLLSPSHVANCSVNLIANAIFSYLDAMLELYCIRLGVASDANVWLHELVL